MNKVIRIKALIALLGLSCLTACNSEKSTVTVSESDVRTALRVMSFNIEWGGTNISFDKVVDAIRLSGADVVGIQEAEGNLQRLASDLGWHFDLRNYVISKYPLVDPPGADGRYVLVEVEPGRIVVIANLHLPSDPYGPDAVRDGATPAEVLEIERAARMPQLEQILMPLIPMIAEGFPVFITGDFNAPAHTDWTESSMGTRKFLRYPLIWPVSRAVSEAGFRDSWREVYPDPVTHPGLTWWAGRPPLDEYSPGENDAQDRIDYIWSAGPVEVQNSLIIGEIDGPEVSISLTPWPSDHRAVVSDFLVVPSEMPELISTGSRVYKEGEHVEITYNKSSDSLIRVSRVDGTDDTMKIVEKKVTGLGRLSLAGTSFVPGHYRVQTGSVAGDEKQSREFWVLAEESVPQIKVLGSFFIAGEPICVQWDNAPGNRNDYLAIQFPEAESTALLAWTYIDALPSGHRCFDSNSSLGAQLRAPGKYNIRLLKDDGYEVLAESRAFTINSPLVSVDKIQTYSDGRLAIEELYSAWQVLLNLGWQLDIVAQSKPKGTKLALPIVAIRSPIQGPAAWFLAGIHGEEPAGPIAIARSIQQLAVLGKRHPVVILPLLNPQGYVRNWRYLNTPEWSADIEGLSVGDSSHNLMTSENSGIARAPASSIEAETITNYILGAMSGYPARYSIDLHEDNLIDEGYVYSQGSLGAEDPLASLAVRILQDANIAIKTSGQTRFEEDITQGIIGPVSDSSIDEFMSSKLIISQGRIQPGPGAETVLVFETPAGNLTLEQRVVAHSALISQLANIIGNL